MRKFTKLSRSLYNVRATIQRILPAFRQIQKNKPAPPRSTAVVLSLSLDDPNRRVFQNVGGFGRWPIMYRYFLRHIHASGARWCGRPEKRDHKNGSEELAWGAASKGSTPWELFLRCFKFESLTCKKFCCTERKTKIWNLGGGTYRLFARHDVLPWRATREPQCAANF